jgi:hypothetical protein
MSTINDMGIPGVGTGYLQPKLGFKWRVTFANIGGGVSSQPLSLQVITATRPSYAFEEVVMDRYTTKSYIPGKYTFEPLNITVEDDITGSASSVIQAQSQQQQWLTGAEGPFFGTGEEGSLFKFTTYLVMLDGKEQPVETWTYEGCFIRDFDYGEGDYTSSETMKINLVIRYDHARQFIGGYSAGEGVALGGAGRTNFAG